MRTTEKPGIWLLLLMLSACGGGSDDDSATLPPGTTNNLEAIELQVMTADPRIAYPLLTTIAIYSDEGADNVSVSLFAIENDDNPATETRQFPLGTHTIERVEAGSGLYQIEANIPSTIKLAGSYFISAVVDPVNLIAETDENDNLVSVESVLSEEGSPNIILQDLALDRMALEINTSSYAQQLAELKDNVHNPDAGATIVVGSDGLSENTTIDLEAYAVLRLNRTDNGASHDVPLYLWNTAENRYMNAYGVNAGDECVVCAPDSQSIVDPEWLPVGNYTPQRVTASNGESALDDLDRHSVYMNFYFPGRLGQEMELWTRYPNANITFDGATVPPPDLNAQSISDLRNFLSGLPSSGIDGDESVAMAAMQFEICVSVRATDQSIVDSTPEDNQKCSPLMITLPPLPPLPLPDNTPEGFTPEFLFVGFPFLNGDVYKTRGGNSSFGFELDFSATASADNRGYIEELRGSVPVRVFGRRIDFMSFSAKVQLVPDYAGKPATEKSGYQVSLRHLGQILHSEDFPAIAPPAVSISFSKEAPDPEKSFQAFVGPVPVTGGASVAANIGLEYEFEFSTNADVCVQDPTISFITKPENCLKLGNSISPFMNVEATIFAGVGGSLFAAGVEGVLSLLDERFTLFSGVQIDVKNDGFDSGIAEFIISQGTRLDFILTGPRGAINLFAKYTVPAFEKCNWGPIPAFCPVLRTLKATKNIVRTPALFQLKDNLFKVDNLQLNVVVVPGEEPGYYSR